MRGAGFPVVELCDVVELTVGIPEEGLITGATGTVVHIYHDPNLAYEVEFTDDKGRTIAMLQLTPDQVRPWS